MLSVVIFVVVDVVVVFVMVVVVVVVGVLDENGHTGLGDSWKKPVFDSFKI